MTTIGVRLLGFIPSSNSTRVNSVDKDALANGSGEDADVLLVKRASAGDVESFRVLVERYQQRAHAIALGIVGNYQDAEDVVQEAFVKAHRNLQLFRGQSSFYTWLYRIVFNLAIDLSRKRYRFSENAVGDARSLDLSAQANASRGDALVGHVATGEQGYERKELGKRISAALESLSPEHRAVIMLREVHGLSYTEISDTVRCSKGTVMSRLHHARKRLQKALHDLRPEVCLSRAENVELDQHGQEREQGMTEQRMKV